MDEQLWIASDDVGPMLAYHASSATDRKKRLLVAACARAAWSSLSAEGRQGIEVAERVSDGGGTMAELQTCRTATQQHIAQSVDILAIRGEYLAWMVAWFSLGALEGGGGGFSVLELE